MYFLPIILIKILDFTNPGDELAALSHYLGYGLLGIMLIFFIIYPIALAILGIIAGTDIKKLWWIPFLPILFFLYKIGPEIKEAPELILYCFGGVFIEIIAMVITHLINKK